MKKRLLSLVVAFLMVFGVLPNQSAMAEEQASGVANPNFTVQYYANLEVLSRQEESGYHKLHVIDATDSMPVNMTTPKTIPVYLENVGGGKMEMATEMALTEVYSAENFTYKDAPSIYYFDKLAQNGNYTLDEIWMLKEDVSADSTDRADWIIYDAQQEFHFTNRPETANDEALQPYNFILIEEGDVIRLVYDTTDAEYSKDANLYDYNITDGNLYKSMNIDPANTYSNLEEAEAAGKIYYVYTKEQGINSAGNYSGSGSKLAFGNVNTKTGLGELTWVDGKGKTNTPNRANIGSYDYCTFGLVSSLDANGNIIYSNGVTAPKLFEEGEAAGKTAYEGGILEFRQDGDTYTLSGVSMTDGKQLASNLEQFINPSNSHGKHSHIYTNSFWIMDQMSATDIPFGATSTQDTQYSYGANEVEGNSRDNNAQLPESDDGLTHNSYFGMSYTVEFGLSEDYVGPLEWIFYGDDDLWVFLDGQLICDIGGVHSSVGQYVDMWKYLEDDRQALLNDSKVYSSTHTLKIFYTERGASGSTCYMRFSLPSVSTIRPISTTGQLKVSKDVLTTGTNGTDKDFEFTIKLKDASGEPLKDDYVYDKYRVGEAEPYEKDLVIWDNGTFSLKDDEYIIIKYLPGGTTYEIDEAAYVEYITSAENEDGTIVIDQTQEAKFTNTRKGTITVSKTVEGNDRNKDQNFEFKVTLSDTSINGTYGDMTFVNGVATFTLKDGESKTAENLPIGITYTVEETLDSHYVTTITGEVTGTIEAGGIYEVAFTNTRKGNLTVEKTVDVGTDKNKQQPFTFTVTLSDTSINGTYGDMSFENGVATFTLKHGEKKTATELPAHITYTVEETPHENYDTTIPENASGTIEPAGDHYVVFVNSSKLGDLIVTKIVSENATHKNDEFTFTVTLDDNTVNGTYGEMEFVDGVATFTLKHGESKKAEGIPAGTAYTVVEQADDLYVTSYENEVGEIVAGEAVTATVTNEHKVGGLTVMKTVTGTAGNKERDFHFTVTLSDKMINGTFGDMVFVDGVAHFTLRHDESITAKGLLVGVEYIVTEEKVETYKTSYKGRTGEIVADEVQLVSVKNHKDLPTTPVNPTSPPTGDTAPVAAWFAAALCSMAMVFMALKKRRQ